MGIFRGGRGNCSCGHRFRITTSGCAIGFFLLGFGAHWQAAIDACAAEFGDAVRGHVIVGQPGDRRHYVDSEGHARAAYGEGALFAMRPDNYIGLATAQPDIAKVTAYLKRIAG